MEEWERASPHVKREGLAGPRDYIGYIFARTLPQHFFFKSIKFTTKGRGNLLLAANVVHVCMAEALGNSSVSAPSQSLQVRQEGVATN